MTSMHVDRDARPRPRFRWPGWAFVLGLLLAGGTGPYLLLPRSLVAQEAEGEPPREVPLGMDRIDMRAAEDPSHTEQLSLVRKSFERQRWIEGVQQLQSLLDAEQDSLVFGEERVWRPVSQVALGLLRSYPEPARQAYESQFGVIAERDLERARQSHDLPGLVQVMRRFLLTPAGQMASRELIDAAIDHGNIDSVSKQIRDLLRMESPLLRDAAWRDQIADLLQDAGETEVVTQLRALPVTGESTAAKANPWQLAPWKSPPPLLRQWTTIGGTHTGQGVAQTQDWSQLPRWRVSLLPLPRVRSHLHHLYRTFEDEHAMGLSVLSAVGTDGVVVARTLSGLVAVDAGTGQKLWESRYRDRPLEDSNESEMVAEVLRRNSTVYDEDLDNMLGYRIRNRLTVYGSLGTLSASRNAIYSLESAASEDLLPEEYLPSGLDESEDSQVYMYARELRTGRILWRAGGAPAEEPPGVPAAGVFFFGPPTPDGDELFVVGEQEGDIRLYCLEAETGLVRWSQLLAAAGRRLREDAIRKSWATPVAVRGSLVVCPTTAGWLTAVDRVTRKLVWSTRMVTRTPEEGGTEESRLAFDGTHRMTSLDERWPPQQPILLRDRVIVTPIEFPDETGETQPQVMCFRLNNGELVWTQPKYQMIGVVGANERSVFLFQQQSLQAISSETGQEQWSRPIPEVITGRPLLTGQGIVVPTATGSLLRVSLESGELESGLADQAIPPLLRRRPRLTPNDASEELSLGSLMAIDERLISVSPLEMTAFEWKSEQEIWQRDAPSDTESALRWCRSLQLRGQYEEAITVIRQARMLNTQDAALQTRVQQALFTAIRLQVESTLLSRSPSETSPDKLQELIALANTPQEREAVQRLTLELAISRQDWPDAWTRIQAAIRDPLKESVVADVQTVSPDVWLADRIRSLGQIPDLTARAAMRETIQTEFRRLWAASADSETRERLLRLFAETPVADVAELESLAGQSAPSGQLLALSKSRDRQTAWQASLRLIEQLANPDWVAEGRRRLNMLPPVGEWPADLKTRRLDLEKKLAVIEDIHRLSSESWLGAQIEVVRQAEQSGVSTTELPLVWLGDPCEALLNYHYFYDNVLHQVAIIRADGSRYGEIKLAADPNQEGSPNVTVLYGSGLQIYLSYHGAIYSYSVPEQKMLWRRRLDRNSNRENEWYSPSPESGALRSPAELAGSTDGSQEWSQFSVFEAANSRQVVIRSRRGIQVLSALTGAVLWEMPECPIAPVRCDADRIYRLHGSETAVYSIRSGRPAIAPDLSDVVSRFYPSDPSAFLLLQEQPGDGQSWELARHQLHGVPLDGADPTDRQLWDEQDVLQLEAAWKQTVSADSWLGHGPPGQVVWIEHGGAAHLIDAASGRDQALGNVPLSIQPPPTGGQKPALNAFWDRSRVYVVARSTAEGETLECPAADVNGLLSVHSRDQSTPHWHLSVQGHMLMQSFRIFPCLALVDRQEKMIADFSTQTLHLTLLDKSTGGIVYELTTPSWGTMISGGLYLPSQARWELYLQFERLRFTRRAPRPAP